jgi:hypothetical protein
LTFDARKRFVFGAGTDLQLILFVTVVMLNLSLSSIHFGRKRGEMAWLVLPWGYLILDSLT